MVAAGYRQETNDGEGRCGVRCLFDQINEPADLRHLSEGDLVRLAAEIREFIVQRHR